MDAFVRFARTGNPGWKPYSLKRRETMIFDTVSRVENDPRRWERELFARDPLYPAGDMRRLFRHYWIADNQRQGFPADLLDTDHRAVI